MKKLLGQVASLGVLGLVIAVLPGAASGGDGGYEQPGRLFGGVDVGVMQPVNAFDRYVRTGGVLSPFIGYKFFQDKDLQLNLGILAQAQFIGASAHQCSTCVRGTGDKDVYALGGTIGPRASVPVGPTEFYGVFGLGGIEGFTSKSALSEGSWGFSTGGGINYSLNENVMVGAFGRYNEWFQHAHALGYVRYATAGVGVTLQQSPPPPPPPPAPPVAQAPPPPPAAKKKIVLRGVNFDFNKSNIRPDAVPILEQACSILKQESNIDVSCNGYTDGIGSVPYNLKLSDRRANAVRDWLVKCGISAKRLTTKGFGKSDPVASNATAEGRAQNRRTELVVVNQ
jgi:outer membrane protein OmpA-like peptidoglycan-associated protein